MVNYFSVLDAQCLFCKMLIERMNRNKKTFLVGPLRQWTLIPSWYRIWSNNRMKLLLKLFCVWKEPFKRKTFCFACRNTQKKCVCPLVRSLTSFYNIPSSNSSDSQSGIVTKIEKEKMRLCFPMIQWTY